MDNVRIAIDAMSGDNGPDIIIPATISALHKHLNLHLILVGNQSVLNNYLKKHKCLKSSRLTVHHASEIVEMDELPSQALRFKKDSSLRVAIDLVKEGKAQACVSAGNTGALMATARFVLKTIAGINRPAIIGAIPARNKYQRVRILDLGANVDSSADVLFQFAVIGSVLTAAVDGQEHPKVALLNIGEEEIKGNDRVKLAARMLSETKEINYIGYVEGDDIFKGTADVIVCDGFVGNVALKSIEGLMKFIARIMKKEFRRNLFTKLSALLASFVLRSIRKSLNPELYNGASFVGLKGIVIKSHGRTTVLGFESAIERAISEVDHNVPELIQNEVAHLLDKSEIT